MAISSEIFDGELPGLEEALSAALPVLDSQFAEGLLAGATNLIAPSPPSPLIRAISSNSVKHHQTDGEAWSSMATPPSHWSTFSRVNLKRLHTVSVVVTPLEQWQRPFVSLSALKTMTGIIPFDGSRYLKSMSPRCG